MSDIRWHKMLRDARVTGSGNLRRGIVVVSTGRKGPTTMLHLRKCFSPFGVPECR